ncbi:MAG: phosphodiester glycosidase family protein [Polyangiaceae bacterium]|nr:phosphodiester glycosidase family protein [Polyangiaceae bacterium]
MSESNPDRKRKILRVVGVMGAVGVVSVVVLWIAIHRYPPLATFLVDGVRKVVGPKPIAAAEDLAYGVQDWLNRWRYKDAAPTTYWEVPSGSAAPAVSAAPTPAASGSGAASAAVFQPTPFAPPYPGVATPGDGVWIPVPSPQDPSGPPALFKALVHPDPKRSFAVVAIVAIDLTRVEMQAVPGFGEPASAAMAREKRTGLIPASRHGDLLAAFNGGFQAVHGRWGMMVDGVTLLAPRPIGCTVARYKDGAMKVAVWKRMADTEAEMQYYRQTPPCLIEDGQVNPATQAEKNTGWGATVDGDTIIRRSGFGLDATGKIGFYVMGDALSAGTLAKALHVAGAHDAAQLDVNFAYPRFFFFDGNQASPPRITQPLAPLQNWKNDEYVTRPELRDFFYLARKTKAP